VAIWSYTEQDYNSAAGHFVWLVRSPGQVSHCTFVRHLHYINVQKHAHDTSVITFLLHWLTVSRVRAASIVRRLSSGSSRLTAPYKLSFYYYFGMHLFVTAFMRINAMTYITGNAEITSIRRRSRNNDELSSWSCVDITSTEFPAKTIRYICVSTTRNTNSLLLDLLLSLAIFTFEKQMRKIATTAWRSGQIWQKIFTLMFLWDNLAREPNSTKPCFENRFWRPET